MIINIDYLKLHLKLDEPNYSPDFKKKKLKYSSRHFAVLEEIYMYDLKVATLESQPHSSILEASSALLKIENRYLYSTELNYLLSSIIHYLNAEIKGISRLDLCADFVKFKNNITPSNLINSFLKEKYLRNGRGKYTVIGSQQNVRSVEYLRFGSKASAVNVYLYNKSLEMNQVKHKHYIEESWKDLERAENQDVWRLEVSLTTEAMKYVDYDTGEYFTIGLSHVLDNNFIKKLYYSLVLKYFQFKINDNTKNKTRMRALQLFDIADMQYHRIKFTERKDVTRRDKVFLKSVYQFKRRYPCASESAVVASSSVLSSIQKDTFLYKYFQDKKHYWDKEEM